MVSLSRLNISILGINYFPELTGIGPYTTEFAEYLVNNGHKVTMYTSFPYYPHWKKDKKNQKKLYSSNIINGVVIKRNYVYVPKKINTFKRILHELSFIISSALRLLFSEHPDIMIVIMPPLGLGYIAYKYCKKRDIPLLVHIQDLQPDAAVELDMMKPGFFINKLYKLENSIYKNSSKVSVITEKMMEKVVSKGMNPEKLLLFPNWVDIEYITPQERYNSFREKHGLGDKFIALYSGNIGFKQGLETILDVAGKTTDKEDIVYIIAGEGNYKKLLIKKYKRMKLNNVIFMSVSSSEEFPLMLAAADVCLIPQRKGVKDLVMPSKLLGIMASGRPVIAGAYKESNLYNIINEADNGYVVVPEDIEDMKEAIMQIYYNKTLAEKMGQNSRKYCIEHFSKDVILRKFEKDLRVIYYS